MLKKKIYYILNFFINLILFFNNLLIIFCNILLINRAEILIFQNKRIGFGNIFTSIDLARKIFEKKKFYLLIFMMKQDTITKKFLIYYLRKK